MLAQKMIAFWVQILEPTVALEDQITHMPYGQ